MIIKYFETKKINLKIQKLILFYGKNEGFKDQEIKNLSKNFLNISNYEQKEIIENSSEFLESIFTNSLFNEKRFIIINRANDKIFQLIEEISLKDIGDNIILINSDNLDKKSKLRNFFEKNKNAVCTAFYPDNNQTLLKIATSYLNEKKISISYSNLNLIINRCNEDRGILLEELNKLILFGSGGKPIDLDIIKKLTNIAENHDISSLIDQCLSKNKKNVIRIVNENNFSNEDCIKITRIFLLKAKKIYYLSLLFENNNDMDLTISSARPPIFWKDKELIKQQIYKWGSNNLRGVMYGLNELELLIKKNVNNSINLTTNFLLEQAS
tara:strand:- start:937 stop:1914 length:978 start_codon:yes stop_codon:yes gene_type:complete